MQMGSNLSFFLLYFEVYTKEFLFCSRVVAAPLLFPEFLLGVVLGECYPASEGGCLVEIAVADGVHAV